MIGLWVDSNVMQAASNPTSAADYNSLFSQRERWGGGDSARTVELDDGRVLWVFGDTWVGSVVGPNRLTDNSLLIQEGKTFHAAWGGEVNARTTPMKATRNGDKLWPTGGVERDGIVRLIMQRVSSGMAVVGTDVVTLDVDTMTIVSTQPAAAPYGIRWSGFVQDVRQDGYVYVCGTQGLAKQYVARTTFEGLTARSWEVWSPVEQLWTTDPLRMKPITVTGGGTFSHFFAQPYDGGWLISGKVLDGSTDDLTLWRADEITGPYQFVGKDSTIGDADWYTYSARVQRLPGIEKLTAVYSRNSHLPNTPETKALYGVVVHEPSLALVNWGSKR